MSDALKTISSFTSINHITDKISTCWQNTISTSCIGSHIAQYRQTFLIWNNQQKNERKNNTDSICFRFLNSISHMYMERSQFDDFLRKGAYGKMSMKAQMADSRHPQPGPSGLSRPRRGSRPRSGREMTDVEN